jgi:protein-S-isoprenylcysteine O-methyltransferase Ste14
MAEKSVDSPGVKLPPPIVYAVPLAAGIVITRWFPLLSLPSVPARIAGGILVIVGLGLAMWACMIFLRRGTSVLPIRPASVLVDTGPFRVSRNPIYVGFTAAYIGASLPFQSLWSLLLLPLVLVVMQKAVIDREEAYLERRFGAEYLSYKSRVRRWL